MSRILYAIFALSGAVSLAFEALWFRQASLVFGNGVWASSLVLSSFMAGIALGNGLAARYAARARRPVAVYALLEAAIAISGVGLVWTLPSLTSVLTVVLGPFFEQPWILNLVRLAVGFGVLLVPATAMGATLPLLVRGMHAYDLNFGSVLGRLYGSNTLGAMFGAVAGEMFLIEWLGVRGSAVSVGMLGLAVAVGALLIARRLPGPAREAPTPKADARDGSLSLTAWCCLAAACLSGGSLLALEVVWFRFLHLFAHGGGLAFSLMLATVLLGIALGGTAGGAWQRRNPLAYRASAGLAFVTGCASIAVYWGFQAVIAPYQLEYVRRASDVLWLAFCLTFLPSFLSGVLFTFMGAALEREVAPDSRATGLLTLSNTLGAGLGSLCAGFLLLPYIGMERSFYLLSGLYGIVGVLLLRVEASRRGAGSPLRRLLAPAALLVAIALFPSGMMERDYLQIPVLRQGGSRSRVVETREGALQTIIYLRDEIDGEPISHHLLTDGYSMSGTGEQGRRYMSLFVHWAVAMRPEPKRALLISYGVGVTAEALTQTSSLEEIDVVDTSRAILESSEVIYPDPERHPLRDPRVRVHIEDGRYFLERTRQSYDLITGEPPPPKIAGVANLYTREYFQLVYDRLSPGGINTYWLPAHNLTEPDAKAIIRAYCDVFGDCALWSGGYLDWMLTGSRELSHPASEDEFSSQWSDASVGPRLRGLGLDSPELMGSLFIAGPEQLREMTLGVAPLVDDFPKRLGNELPSAATEERYVRWLDADMARKRFAESQYIQRMWPVGLREGTLAHFDFQRMLVEVDFSAFANPLSDLHRVLDETSYRYLALRLLGQDGDAIQAVLRLIARGAPDARYPIPLGANALAARNYAGAARHFERALARRPKDERLFFLYLYTLWMSNDFDRAQTAAARVSSRFPELSNQGLAAHDWLRETFDLAF
jgi:spermidine synthase